jgi:putative DNA primase/helicase
VETNPFARADLEHLLAMVDDDMKLEALPQTNYIKTIVTAEQPLDLEKKGKQSYQGWLYSRFMVFGNGVMKSLYDRSEGFFRRQLILSVKEKEKDRYDDPFIAEKMCAEAEGILLWALEGLRRLIQNNYHFTTSERTKTNREEAIRDGNNIVDFMESEGYFRFKADHEISSKDFYEIYDVWCRDNAEKPLVAKSFSSYLIQHQKDYNLEYNNKVRNKQGRRVWGFWGVEPLIQIYG